MRPGPVERARDALARIRERRRPEAWIHVRPEADVLADAVAVERRLEAGEELPLAGITVAVKDNIDLAGVPTTAACPAFAYTPDRDATAVARLRAAGAVMIGKSNLDQFATGLVGTRTPYGPVRDVRSPERISGGSSSGTAVSVALGEVDLGLATDTAGSGRVPAAFQGIVGFKPTRGLVPVRGVVPACRSFDCVSLLARAVGLVESALGVLGGVDPGDPLSRSWPADAPRAAPASPRVAVVGRSALAPLSDEGRAAYGRACERLRAGGVELVEIDVGPLLAAGRLLYEGAFVAERHAAVGRFVAEHRREVDPVVGFIIAQAARMTAADYVADVARIDEVRARLPELLAGCDALLLPTAPFQPTFEEVAADPLECNRRLGVYTTFCNLLDLCALALPAGAADGGCFGVTLLAPAFHELVLADLARLLDAGGAEAVGFAPLGALGALGALGRAVPLLVVGAHMTGGPLSGELTGRGARLLGPVSTAPRYRLFALDTDPPKPGLVRGDRGGAIAGELWALPPVGLASLLSALPAPMALGRVALEDGSEVVGFLCEPAALDGAEEITSLGGWRAYLDASSLTRTEAPPAR